MFSTDSSRRHGMFGVLLFAIAMLLCSALASFGAGSTVKAEIANPINGDTIHHGLLNPSEFIINGRALNTNYVTVAITSTANPTVSSTVPASHGTWEYTWRLGGYANDTCTITVTPVYDAAGTAYPPATFTIQPDTVDIVLTGAAYVEPMLVLNGGSVYSNVDNPIAQLRMRYNSTYLLKAADGIKWNGAGAAEIKNNAFNDGDDTGSNGLIYRCNAGTSANTEGYVTLGASIQMVDPADPAATIAPVNCFRSIFIDRKKPSVTTTSRTWTKVKQSGNHYYFFEGTASDGGGIRSVAIQVLNSGNPNGNRSMYYATLIYGSDFSSPVHWTAMVILSDTETAKVIATDFAGNTNEDSYPTGDNTDVSLSASAVDTASLGSVILGTPGTVKGTIGLHCAVVGTADKLVLDDATNSPLLLNIQKGTLTPVLHTWTDDGAPITVDASYNTDKTIHASWTPNAATQQNNTYKLYFSAYKTISSGTQLITSGPLYFTVHISAPTLSVDNVTDTADTNMPKSGGTYYAHSDIKVKGTCTNYDMTNADITFVSDPVLPTETPAGSVTGTTSPTVTVPKQVDGNYTFSFLAHLKSDPNIPVACNPTATVCFDSVKPVPTLTSPSGNPAKLHFDPSSTSQTINIQGSIEEDHPSGWLLTVDYTANGTPRTAVLPYHCAGSKTTDIDLAGSPTTTNVAAVFHCPNSVTLGNVNTITLTAYDLAGNVSDPVATTTFEFAPSGDQKLAPVATVQLHGYVAAKEENGFASTYDMLVQGPGAGPLFPCSTLRVTGMGASSGYPTFTVRPNPFFPTTDFDLVDPVINSSQKLPWKYQPQTTYSSSTVAVFSSVRRPKEDNIPTGQYGEFSSSYFMTITPTYPSGEKPTDAFPASIYPTVPAFDSIFSTIDDENTDWVNIDIHRSDPQTDPNSSDRVLPIPADNTVVKYNVSTITTKQSYGSNIATLDVVIDKVKPVVAVLAPSTSQTNPILVAPGSVITVIFTVKKPIDDDSFRTPIQREISAGFKGQWNASTNTPAIASLSPRNGDYYLVITSGTTPLSGITDWALGDIAYYNGTKWIKVDISYISLPIPKVTCKISGNFVNPTTTTDAVYSLATAYKSTDPVAHNGKATVTGNHTDKNGYTVAWSIPIDKTFAISKSLTNNIYKLTLSGIQDIVLNTAATQSVYFRVGLR